MSFRPVAKIDVYHLPSDSLLVGWFSLVGDDQTVKLPSGCANFSCLFPLPWYPNIGPCQRSISEPTEFTLHSHFYILICLKLWENSGSTGQLNKSQIFKSQNFGLEILTFWNIGFLNSSSSWTWQKSKWISLGDILIWGGGSSSPGRYLFKIQSIVQ